MKVDVSNAELIGASDTEKPGRLAVTRISLYYLPEQATGRCFVAQVEALYDGKVTSCFQLYVGDLDRALGYFKPGAMTDDVKLLAEDWWERNEERVQVDLAVPETSPPAGFASDSLVKVLGWLYQGEEGDVSKKAARDFGIPDRTIRDAIAKEAAGDTLTGWARAFVASMAYFDRAAWNEARS